MRLTAKIAFPTETVSDEQADFGAGAKPPAFFYAFSAGFAALRSPTFAMSPGLMFARTDVSDYGSMLGLSLPFDWVTQGGLRLGLEGGLGRAFGGQRAVSCSETAVGLQSAPQVPRSRRGLGALAAVPNRLRLQSPGAAAARARPGARAALDSLRHARGHRGGDVEVPRPMAVVADAQHRGAVVRIDFIGELAEHAHE